MNKKQKMIRRMWLDYKYSCEAQRIKPCGARSYKYFKNSYNIESFEEILEMKNWFKMVKNNHKNKE